MKAEAKIVTRIRFRWTDIMGKKGTEGKEKLTLRKGEWIMPYMSVEHNVMSKAGQCLMERGIWSKLVFEDGRTRNCPKFHLLRNEQREHKKNWFVSMGLIEISNFKRLLKKRTYLNNKSPTLLCRKTTAHSSWLPFIQNWKLNEWNKWAIIIQQITSR